MQYYSHRTTMNSWKFKIKKVQKEYRNLLDTYYHSIQFTSGCGPRAQHYIDDDHSKLAEFVDKHPEFKLPEKHICVNDGTNGLSTGLAIFAKRAGMY